MQQHKSLLFAYLLATVVLGATLTEGMTTETSHHPFIQDELNGLPLEEVVGNSYFKKICTNTATNNCNLDVQDEAEKPANCRDRLLSRIYFQYGIVSIETEARGVYEKWIVGLEQLSVDDICEIGRRFIAQSTSTTTIRPYAEAQTGRPPFFNRPTIIFFVILFTVVIGGLACWWWSVIGPNGFVKRTPEVEMVQMELM